MHEVGPIDVHFKEDSGSENEVHKPHGWKKQLWATLRLVDYNTDRVKINMLICRHLTLQGL
jgi:hypothetical protein